MTARALRVWGSILVVPGVAGRGGQDSKMVGRRRGTAAVRDSAVVGAGPIRWLRPWWARDLAAAGGVAALAAMISRTSFAGEFLAQASVLLALAAAALAVAAAVTAAVISRLSADPRTPWIGAAMALYGLVAVPATAIGSAIEPVRGSIGITRLTAHTLVVILLLVAARPPQRLHGVRDLKLIAAATLVIVVAAGSAIAAPDWAASISSDDSLRLGVAAAWLAAGVALSAWGLAAEPTTGVKARVGLGVAVMALAHTYRISSELSQPITAPGLVFSCVRLLAVGLVVTGLVTWAVRAIHEVTAVTAEYEEQLLAATIGQEEISERDHELRNGLAGLAGVAGNWQKAAHDEQQLLLGAVTTELARLDVLLDRTPPRPSGDAVDVDVVPVLRAVVALRRRAGMSIHCATEPELAALVPAPVISQVLVNVLTNCARHAPYSPVHIQARQVGTRIRVRISDFGPGVPAGTDELMFNRGTRAPGTTAGEGHGLGLHISRTLLAAHDATITIRPRHRLLRGCIVDLELPALEPTRRRAGVAPVHRPGQAPTASTANSPDPSMLLGR
jgi:two-component system OmpR family sensor kinase